jgi:hypothetical protein
MHREHKFRTIDGATCTGDTGVRRAVYSAAGGSFLHEHAGAGPTCHLPGRHLPTLAPLGLVST